MTPDNVTKFPGVAPMPEAKDAIEVAERKNKLAKTCLELEEPIFRAAMLAEIAVDLMFEDCRPEGELREQTAWATMELCSVVREIRKIFKDDEASNCKERV
jgi:hypothetical protein